MTSIPSKKELEALEEELVQAADGENFHHHLADEREKWRQIPMPGEAMDAVEKPLWQQFRDANIFRFRRGSPHLGEQASDVHYYEVRVELSERSMDRDLEIFVAKACSKADVLRYVSLVYTNVGSFKIREIGFKDLRTSRECIPPDLEINK